MRWPTQRRPRLMVAAATAVVVATRRSSGEAVQTVCARRDPQFRRVNLEIQGNRDAFLHAHVWPRYEWEGPDQVWRPVALHPIER